jgi:hypothetical protein
METDRDYARKQFHLAVYTLATHPGSIKERLMEAACYLVMVQPRHLPLALRDDVSRLMTTLTKSPSKTKTAVRGGTVTCESTGSLGATIPYMRNATAVKAAKAICAIEARLKAL